MLCLAGYLARLPGCGSVFGEADAESPGFAGTMLEADRDECGFFVRQRLGRRVQSMGAPRVGAHSSVARILVCFNRV
jgi:hypothetical protein